MTEAQTIPPVRGRCCEQRVAIAAPADAVWAVLADFATWPAWNPLYVATQGALTPDGEIAVTVALSGMKPRGARFTVREVKPPRLIEYTSRNLGGLLRVCRYIEITPTGPDACRVSNGEIMGGPVGKLLAKFVGAKVREGLKAMNEGLRVRVEANSPSLPRT